MDSHNSNPGAEPNGLDDLFDFEALSGSPEASTYNSPVEQKQTVNAGGWTCVEPPTQREIEAIMAWRASRTQNSRHSDNLAP
jgi:hypothetical protein